jgi:hypothetical protein
MNNINNNNMVSVDFFKKIGDSSSSTAAGARNVVGVGPGSCKI